MSSNAPVACDGARTETDELLELGEAFVRVAPDWRVTRMNAAAERISGLRRADVVGRVIWDVWPAAARPESAYWGAYHRCMDERVAVSLETYDAPTDRWMALNLHPTADGAVVLFFRDVTALRRAERAAQDGEREARARAAEAQAVLESVADALAVYDADGRVVQSNAAYDRLLGFSGPERALPAWERVARGGFEWYAEDGRPLAAEDLPALRSARRGETLRGVLLRMRGPAGERWVSVSAAPIRLGAERFGAVASIRDITEQKRAEEDLRDSEHRLSVLFRRAPIPRFWTRLPERRFVDVNDAWVELTGVPRDEAIGSSSALLGLVEQDALDRFYDDLQARGSADLELHVSTRSKGDRTVYVRGERVALSDGEFALGAMQDVTEWRRSDARLRDSEEKFRSVFEQAAIGMGRVRFSDARWIDANEAFCRMLGRTREELLSTPWPELTHPEDVDVDLVPFRRMAAGELESYSVEKRFLHRSGRHVWAKLTLSLVRDASGAPDYEIAIIEDVTDRKRAEEAERAAARAAEDERRRLAAVLEALPAGVAITDAAGAFTHVNAEFGRIWGGAPWARSAAEYGDWRGWEPDTGRSIPGADWALSRALASGEVIVPGQVVEIEKFDGTGRATIVNAAAPIRNAEGGIVGGVVAEVDITPQRRAEEAARAAERRMRAVVEHLPSGLIVADLASHQLVWNREALAIHGYTGEGSEHLFLESLVAEHDLRRLDGGALPVDRWPLPRLLAGETFRDYEVLVRNTRLGWERVFSYSGVVLPFDGSQREVGLLAIQDVTDRRRAENGLRAANEQLLEADRRKNDFLGMLSHELRNPLAPIRNALYIMEHADPGGPQARGAREMAARQVTHLTRLVDDLLDVTRIARGKIELRRADLDLGALVRATAEDHRALLQQRGLTLAVEAQPAPISVHGDETRLAQVIGNLLANARKFTPAGGRVTVSAAVEDGGAVLRVRDTGPGIAPDLLPILFEPFTQAQQTLARSEGGLGLGLSLVKGLVALHGGEVTVESRPGAGAEFAVRLPLARAPDATTGPARAPEAVAAQGARRRRVLVVDDNRDAAESLGALVQMLGHEVVLAYDGPGAVAQASRHRPDLVLCDIGLPGMDGYAVARELRARHDGAVRLVALSGYAQPEDVARALESGFDRHVAKPPDPYKIEALLG